jgi:molecular chaperone GrpE (heat shock protein)
MKKINSKISEIQKKSLENSIQKIKRIIDQYDLEIRDYTGIKYNPGITGIEVVSVEKNKNNHEDIVKETLEPAILLRGQIVKKAKVIISSSN